MMTRRRVYGVITVGLLLFTGACAQPAGDGPGDGGSGPDAGRTGELMLRVESVGGFVQPSLSIRRLPMLSVYADGVVLSEGPQIEIFPAPALPNVQIQRISAGGVRNLTELAVRAGVGEQADYGRPAVADATTTRFTVRTDAGLTRSEVYALSEAGDDSSDLTPAQRAARQKLRDLLVQLTDLPETLGQDAVSEAKVYEPVGLAVFATPYVAPQPPDQDQPKIAWPGPALPGTQVGEGRRLWCLDVTGADTEAVSSAAAKATAATPWSSNGQEWTVVFRPVLPDETGCSDVTGAG